MSTDFELFPGKNLSGLFKDIYENQQNKKQRISELISEMRNVIRHAGDMAVIGPILKDLIDSKIPFYKPSREAEILRNISKLNEGPISDEKIKYILNEINHMVDDLGWEKQRMSSSGRITYDKLINFLDKL